MKRKGLYIALTITFLFAFAGCKKKTTTKVNPTSTTKEITEEKKFIVSFDSNGGSSVNSQEVKKDGYASKPNDPTRDGYTFSGWYYNNEEWSFDNVIASNMELEAKWTINSYALILNTDSENGEVSGANTYEYNSDVTIKAIPKDGYIFNGWYNDGVMTDYSQEATFKMPSKDITLEARFVDDPFIYDSENSTIITGLKDKSLTNLVIPEGVTEIGDEVFKECSNLKSITIPNSLTSIGNDSFCECTCEIKWSDNPSITEIGEYAFQGYKGTSLTIPNSVTSIGEFAFYYCTELKSLTIPNSVTSIGEYAFCYCACEIKWSDNPSITEIGEDAFSYYEGTSLTIPNSVTSIGEYAFYSCSKLKSLTIPNNVTSIGEYAFCYCTCEIKWGDNPSITEIGEYAFSYYEGTSLTIPNSVTSIGDYAFRNCTGLTSLTISNNVTNIGKSAFGACSDLSTIIVDPKNAVFDSRDNCNAIIKKENNALIVGCKNTTIPNSVTSIGEYAFYYCTELKNITIPNNVISIENNALDLCTSLTSITLPNSITSIEKSTFSCCNSLKSVTIPESVTSIEMYAFFECNNLSKVYYKGTSSQWNDIAIDLFENDCLINATRYYYTNNVASETSEGNLWYYDTDGVTIIEVLEYDIDFNLNGGSGVIDNQKIKAGRTISKPNDPIRDGYTFDGWYYNDKKWSFTDDVVNDNMILTAEWIANTNTAYKVEHCLQNLDDAYSLFETENLTGTTDTLTNASVKTYEGFTAPSITQVNINGNGSTVVVLKYTRNSYIVELSKNTDNVGTISGSGTYAYEKSVTVIATLPNLSTYTFDGWYLDDKRVSTDLEYTFNMPSKNISLEARYLEAFNYDSENPTKITGLKNKSLTNLVIPDGVTGIGKEAFKECSNLTYITIPDSVTSIGEAAFYNCTSLTSITIPKNITSIEKYTFVHCTCEIKWKDNPSITTINENAFGRYEGTSLTIPNSVTSLGKYAFFECTSEIIFEDNISITEIGEYAFQDYKGTSLTIPNSVTSIGQYAFYNCASEILFEDNSSVTTIGENAFKNYKGTSLTIPNSVTSIGEYAFYNCTCEILWGDNPSITEIGKYAFSFYKGTSLTIPNSVKSIGHGAFNVCTGLTSLTIPDSVTSIGDSAFNYCIELISITIPDSIKTIGDSAFYDCRKLIKVYYKGTISQWNSITIGSNGNDALTNATRYYYTNNGASETTLGNFWYYDTDGVTIIEKVVE